MLITVQKQVSETLEVKTPCYYKTIVGYQHINAKGQIITVYSKMIALTEPSEDKYYTSDVQNLMQHGKPCAKDEFDKAYAEAKAFFDIAVEAVLF